VTDERSRQRGNMKRTDWTLGVGLPAARLYRVLEALAAGDVRRPIGALKKIEPHGEGRSSWLIEAQGRRAELLMTATERRPHEFISLHAAGKGIEAVLDVTLSERGVSTTSCAIAAYRHLSFVLELLAGPTLSTQHDRIGRAIVRGLEDIAQDYPDLA
jgi:hypothetical protein